MKSQTFAITTTSSSRRFTRMFLVFSLLLVPVFISISLAAGVQAVTPTNGTQNGAQNGAENGGNHSWNINLGPNTQLTGDQFEEYVCAPNSSAGVPGAPPAKLMGWNNNLHTWKISLDRTSILQANPNCPEPSYIASQIDSISPLSQTLNNRLFQQGSYRVMYPGREATWNQFALGQGFQQSGAIGEMTIGFQSGEPDVVLPDGTIDYSQYAVQSASFAAVATANPFADLQINGGETVRVHAFFIDYRQGTFYEEQLTQYPASFFLQPHDYSIAWEDTSHNHDGIYTGCAHPFDVVFSIDGVEVARYTNGTTSQNPFVLAWLQGAPLTGLDQRLNAKRCTVPEPTQMFAGVANSDTGGATVGNANIPPVPLTMTIRGMSIEAINH